MSFQYLFRFFAVVVVVASQVNVCFIYITWYRVKFYYYLQQTQNYFSLDLHWIILFFLHNSYLICNTRQATKMHPHTKTQTHMHTYTMKCHAMLTAERSTIIWTENSDTKHKHWQGKGKDIIHNTCCIWVDDNLSSTCSRIMLYDDGQGSLFCMTWTGIV